MSTSPADLRLSVGGRIDRFGRLKLDVETPLPEGDVTVELIVERRTANAARPHWRDFVGTISWAGDAVAEQRRLRDEWPE